MRMKCNGCKFYDLKTDTCNSNENCFFRRKVGKRMGKTIAVASKFTEEELNRIDFFVQERNTTRSTLVHDLVMDAVDGNDSREQILGNSDIKKVRFLFKDNFAYFWKDREYEGIINSQANCANLYFGGEWKTYSLDELPVEILE